MMSRFISVICPICQDEVQAIFFEECSGGYKMLRCSIYPLEFAHPLKGPSKDGYQAWYRGEAIKLGSLESHVDLSAKKCAPLKG